jgi:hypothetical protein
LTLAAMVGPYRNRWARNHVVPQGPLSGRRGRRTGRFVGNHRNGYRANGLRGERVGVRRVVVQVGELSLEATSTTSVEETIQTPQCSMKERQSREIASLPNAWLSFQFRVCSLWHSSKHLFLIPWPEQAK